MYFLLHTFLFCGTESNFNPYKKSIRPLYVNPEFFGSPYGRFYERAQDFSGELRAVFGFSYDEMPGHPDAYTKTSLIKLIRNIGGKYAGQNDFGYGYKELRTTSINKLYFIYQMCQITMASELASEREKMSASKLIAMGYQIYLPWHRSMNFSWEDNIDPSLPRIQRKIDKHSKEESIKSLSTSIMQTDDSEELQEKISNLAYLVGQLGSVDSKEDYIKSILNQLPDSEKYREIATEVVCEILGEEPSCKKQKTRA